MAEYNRFVSYVYAYENNNKTINNGFVRVETRDNISSVYVNMKELYGSGTKYGIYMFQRTDGGLNGICLGYVEGSAGGGEFLCKITKDNINNSGISLNEIAGIIILGESGRKYGTCWDDEPLDAELFAGAAKDGEKIVRVRAGKENVGKFESIRSEKAADESNENSRGEKAAGESFENSLGEKSAGESLESSCEAAKSPEAAPTLKFIPEEEMPEIKPARADKNLSAASDDGVKEMMAESIALSMENTAEAAEFFREPLLVGNIDGDSSEKNKIKTIQKRLDRILDGGIKMYPFEDSEMEKCIRIEIQDIGMLPMKYWFYAGNSFLLQSYYSYRHLILAKRIDGSYILGVPGMGEAKDSFMARRFGFNCFKNIREKSDEMPASNFGYWYVKLI